MTPTLTKIRNTTEVVKVGIFADLTSEAAWVDGEGCCVHRITFHGCVQYWLVDRDGRHSTHPSLGEAREAIAWLRARGR